jgi:hypothetical protein
MDPVVPPLSTGADSPAFGAHRGLPSRPGPLPHRAVLAIALLFGFVTNLLVRSPEGPGLNILLSFLALALGVWAATRWAGRAPSAEAWYLMMAGVLAASGFALRASPTLQFLAFVSAAAAFALPALRAGAAWMSRSGVSDHLEAVVAAAGYSGLGVLRLAAGALGSRDASAEEGEPPAPRRGAAVVRGLLLAAPLLVIFGALFMSADAVFAGMITSLVGATFEEWASHAALTAVFTWLAAGYLTGFLTGTRMRGLVQGALPRPSIGIVEAGIALGLVNLLFAVFVAVQFRYLFGGAHLVEVTPGLTYAEYAREGFGQLAFASALVLPTLLVSDWLLRERTRRERNLFRGLGGLQLLLLGLVIVSAFQRVRAYQEAYGLTESRFYGVVFLGWLVLLGAWFAASVLRGRRERFAFPALVSGFALVMSLLVANPDGWIARTNLARAGVTTGGALSATAQHRPIDAAYLGSLSADAVPVLLEALPRAEPLARCHLAQRLLDRWGRDPEPDWRSWNLSVARARRAVRAEIPRLQGMVEAVGPCVER